MNALDRIDKGMLAILQRRIEQGWADDEILDEREHRPTPARPLLLRQRRAIEAALRELRADLPLQPPGRGRGPSLIATTAEVKAVRDQLRDAGKPHGYGSIAKAGGWSESTVRRRLGVL